jgi:amidase
VDTPAVTFPAGRHLACEYKPLENYSDFRYPLPRNLVEQEVQAQWNPETYNNAPVGLQLVGRRLNEEKLLGMLTVVESAVAAATALKPNLSHTA